MIKPGTYYCVEPERTLRLDVAATEVNVLPQLERIFAENTAVRVANVALIGEGYGMASITATPTMETWTVKVLKLGMEAPFLLRDGLHLPAFAEQNAPVIPMVWDVPDSMNLTLTVILKCTGKVYGAGDQFLVAFDSEKRAWRLPLSNLYDECKLCHGQHNTRWKTKLESVKNACELFSKSRWNRDLYAGKDHLIPKTQAMFRWRPTEGGGFEQQAMLLEEGKDWTSLAEKVGTEFIQRMVAP
jgi:hypothetical protein